MDEIVLHLKHNFICFINNHDYEEERYVSFGEAFVWKWQQIHVFGLIRVYLCPHHWTLK